MLSRHTSGRPSGRDRSPDMRRDDRLRMIAVPTFRRDDRQGVIAVPTFVGTTV